MILLTRKMLSYDRKCTQELDRSYLRLYMGMGLGPGVFGRSGTVTNELAHPIDHERDLIQRDVFYIEWKYRWELFR